MPYKLSAVLKGHNSDVRAVASPTNNLILSASRDATAKSWSRQSDSRDFTDTSTYTAGTRYINSVAYLPPAGPDSQGFIATGGQDAIINIFAIGADRFEPDYTLLGHRDNVCALATTASGTIISGSWDTSARIWQKFTLAFELVGHSQSVWAVLAVDEETFLTGSADKTIKLWRGHKASHTYNGHSQAVRALALVPDIGFASCSNDSEIRVWTTGGDVVHILSGHTSFVYSISILPNGDVISGGEDRSVRVWRDGSCVQTIVHPAISVWTVSSMPNGDIVSGCSDGIIRVFSTSEERWADSETLKGYDELIANQALPSQQIGDVKKNDLPGMEALSQPGKQEGQVIMVRNLGTVEAHQWDSLNSKWQKIGEVVDAVGSTRKQLYQGKEYDYVFDVDIQDGVPPLKLPYNATENPYQAAQRFLESNDLPMTYIDEVVKFIEKNTSGVKVNQSTEEYMDPFTGASRYRSSNQATQPTQSGFSDPFTGGARYQPSQPQPSPSLQDMSQPSKPSQDSQPSTLPTARSLSFKQANIATMKAKLNSFNNEFGSDSPLTIRANETQLFDEMFDALETATTQSSTPVSGRINASHVVALTEVLVRWPSDKRFPLLDLARLISIYFSSAFTAPSQVAAFSQSILLAAEWSSPWTAPLGKFRETNVLLALRALANTVQDTAKGSDLNGMSSVLNEIQKAPFSMLNKNQRVALATLLFNLSTVTVKGLLDRELEEAHLRLIAISLQSEREDAEAYYRSLVALGNTLWAFNTHGRTLDRDLAASFKIALAPSTFSDNRISAVVKEIQKLGVL